MSRMFLLSAHCLRPILQSLIRRVPLSALEVLIHTELLTGVNIAVIKALSLSKIFKGTEPGQAPPKMSGVTLVTSKEAARNPQPVSFSPLPFPALVPFILRLSPVMAETRGANRDP